MLSIPLSSWSCQICSRTFSSSQSLLADLQAHQALLEDCLAQLEKLIEQPSGPPLTYSSQESETIEDEKDQNPALRTETTSHALSGNDATIRCPYPGCTTALPLKTSLNRHFQKHIAINETCAFCAETFSNLRTFVRHFNEKCSGKKKRRMSDENQSEEQRRTIKRKHDWCRLSTTSLDQGLEKHRGMQDKGSSVARTATNGGGKVANSATLLAASTSSTSGKCPKRVGEADGFADCSSNLSRIEPGQSVASSSGGDQEDGDGLGQVSLPSGGNGLLRNIPQDVNHPPSQSQLQYAFSKAPISRIDSLGDLLSKAVQGSSQWKMERDLGEKTTDCLTILIPEDRNHDVAITLWVGLQAGLRMNDIFSLRETWSSSAGTSAVS